MTDYEEELFKYQTSFYDTFLKKYLVEIYFLLKKYIVILAKFKGVGNESDRYFISENMATEFIEKILESSFRIKVSWKSYIIKRMNYYIYSSKYYYGDEEFLENFIPAKNYNILTMEVDKYKIILKYIRYLLRSVVSFFQKFYEFDSYIFKYYLYLCIHHNNTDCLDLLRDKEELKSYVIHAFNFYNYKLKTYLLRGRDSDGFSVDVGSLYRNKDKISREFATSNEE